MRDDKNTVHGITSRRLDRVTNREAFGADLHILPETLH